MAAVKGTSRADPRGSASVIPIGMEFPITWVDLDFVDPGDDNSEADRKAVWQYTPPAREAQGGSDDCGTLRLIFESPGSDVLDNPDNITVSPRGGLVLCEDGGGMQFIRGLTRDGRIFDFAANQFNDTEFAGATFSPDGLTLFVNIQGETSGIATDPGVKGSGMTLAIWGPWAAGAL